MLLLLLFIKKMVKINFDGVQYDHSDINFEGEQIKFINNPLFYEQVCACSFFRNGDKHYDDEYTIALQVSGIEGFLGIGEEEEILHDNIEWIHIFYDDNKNRYTNSISPQAIKTKITDTDFISFIDWTIKYNDNICCKN